jgi:hypothetical protein
VVGVILAAFSSGALLGILGPIQNPLGIEGFSNIYYKAILFIMTPLLTAAAALAVFIRLRRAIGVERSRSNGLLTLLRHTLAPAPLHTVSLE